MTADPSKNINARSAEEVFSEELTPAQRRSERALDRVGDKIGNAAQPVISMNRAANSDSGISSLPSADELLAKSAKSLLLSVKPVMEALDALSTIHPILRAVVVVFNGIVQLELKRRDNSKKCVLIIRQMADMMGALLQLKNIEDPNLKTDRGDTVSGRLQSLKESIKEDLEATGNVIDAYYKQHTVVKFFKSPLWSDQFAEIGSNLEQRKTEITFALTINISVTIKSVEGNVTDIKVLLTALASKQDKYEKGWEEFVESQGGRDACLADPQKLESVARRIVDENFARISERLDSIHWRGGQRWSPNNGPSSTYAQPPTTQPYGTSYGIGTPAQMDPDSTRVPSHSYYWQRRSGRTRGRQRSHAQPSYAQEYQGYGHEPGRGAYDIPTPGFGTAVVLEDMGEIKPVVDSSVRYALKLSLPELLQQNMVVYRNLLNEQTKEIEIIVHMAAARIVGQLQHSSYKGIRDKIFQQIWQENQWGRNILASEFVAALHDYFQDSIPVAEAIIPPPALRYTSVLYTFAISEAFDDDLSGYIRVSEVNKFTDSIPPGWTLQHWIAFWAAGWRVSMSQYAQRIKFMLKSLNEASREVLPVNTPATVDYLDNDVLSWVLAICESVEGPSSDDPELLDVISRQRQVAESSLVERLEKFKYQIDTVEYLPLICGAGRLEKYLLPLFYLLFRRHYQLFKLATTLKFDERELVLASQSLENVMEAVSERRGYLEDLFAQRGVTYDWSRAYANGVFGWTLLPTSRRYPHLSSDYVFDDAGQLDQGGDIPADILLLKLPDQEDGETQNVGMVHRTSTCSVCGEQPVGIRYWCHTCTSRLWRFEESVADVSFCKDCVLGKRSAAGHFLDLCCVVKLPQPVALFTLFTLDEALKEIDTVSRHNDADQDSKGIIRGGGCQGCQAKSGVLWQCFDCPRGEYLACDKCESKGCINIGGHRPERHIVYSLGESAAGRSNTPISIPNDRMRRGTRHKRRSGLLSDLKHFLKHPLSSFRASQDQESVATRYPSIGYDEDFEDVSRARKRRSRRRERRARFRSPSPSESTSSATGLQRQEDGPQLITPSNVEPPAAAHRGVITDLEVKVQGLETRMSEGFSRIEQLLGSGAAVSTGSANGSVMPSQ